MILDETKGTMALNKMTTKENSVNIHGWGERTIPDYYRLTDSGII